MSNEDSWIPWTRVGFTDEQLEHMKKNPIKSSCGTCGRDTTGLDDRLIMKECKNGNNCPWISGGDC